MEEESYQNGVVGQEQIQIQQGVQNNGVIYGGVQSNTQEQIQPKIQGQGQVEKTIKDAQLKKVNIQLQLNKKIQNYSVSSNMIGKGGYGAVYYAIDDNTQEIRAAKIFNSQYMESKQHIKYLMQEKKILSSINHPNIVRLFDVFMTKTNVYFIMEVSFEGDLARYLYQNKGRLPEKRALELFCDIVEGFRCLTQLGIIHRDIKPDNILLFEGRAKIADFGFARFLKNKDEKIQSLTPLGTPLFASPQVIKGEKFSAKTDVYSTGILLYQMLYGILPFIAGGPVELLNQMETKPLTFPQNDQNIGLEVSDKIKDLIRQMLVMDDEKRIGWNQIFQIDFVQQYYQLNYSDQQQQHIESLVKQQQEIQQQKMLQYQQMQQQKYLQQQYLLQQQQNPTNNPNFNPNNIPNQNIIQQNINQQQQNQFNYNNGIQPENNFNQFQ